MHTGVLMSYLYTYFLQLCFVFYFKLDFILKRKTIYLFGIFMGICFLFYLSLVYKVTQIATVWDISRYETWIRVNQINLTLFDTAGSTTYLLNIVLFMPFGFIADYLAAV